MVRLTYNLVQLLKSKKTRLTCRLLVSQPKICLVDGGSS